MHDESYQSGEGSGPPQLLVILYGSVRLAPVQSSCQFLTFLWSMRIVIVFIANLFPFVLLLLPEKRRLSN